MNLKLVGKIISSIAVMFVVILLFVRETEQITPFQQNQEVTQTETVFISIEGLYVDKQLTISANDTVLKVLEDLNTNDSTLQLSVKEYVGIGTLVESMFGYLNGTNDNYWQYQVNNITPLIGADKYQLNDGDIVRWYFGPSEF